MAKNIYIGVNNVSRKVKKMYIGVNGVARKVKKGYIGVNGVARLFYSSRLGYTAFYGTGSIVTSMSGGTIGDYAIFYDLDTYSTGFTAVSNSLTTTTVATTSGYRMYNTRAIIHNNQLMNSVYNNSALVPYLRGINTSLTLLIYTSLSLPYRWRDDNYSYYEEFNNSIYYLYRYEDDDGYGRSQNKKISSSMTISDLSLPAATNSNFPTRGISPEAGRVTGSATTASYLHFMIKGLHYCVYSLNSSETAFLNNYSYVSSSGDSYGFSSTYLKASFDGKAIFGWGGMLSTNTATSTLNDSGVSIDNSLTYMFYNTIMNVAKPLYSFNVVFDNVLWVGTAFHTYDYPKIICKLKSGLTQELDSTYLTTYLNAGGTSNSLMTAALPTSVNDPSFLVCAMSGPGGDKPAMIYQR